MILIIDDDAAVRSSLTFLLKRAGFEPEAVPGPEEALVIVRREAPQLIDYDGRRRNTAIKTSKDI